jgi:hypothetical protein
MSATFNFSDYTVPDYDFGFANIYTIPVPQSQYSTSVQTVDLPVATKTISFTVSDKNGTIPGANISVNGIATAQTDEKGKVTLPNIPTNADIIVSYIGYDNFQAQASNITSSVVINEGATPIDEVNVFTKKKPSNTWLWILVGLGAAYSAYSYSNSGAKVVKAKI